MCVCWKSNFLARITLKRVWINTKKKDDQKKKRFFQTHTQLGYSIQLFSQVLDTSETMTQSPHMHGWHTHRHTRTNTHRNLIKDAFTVRKDSTARRHMGTTFFNFFRLHLYPWQPSRITKIDHNKLKLPPYRLISSRCLYSPSFSLLKRSPKKRRQIWRRWSSRSEDNSIFGLTLLATEEEF